MEFGILGSLQLLHAGRQVRVPAGGQRDLIALLVVEAGRVVPAERLVDALWGEDLPANPGNALQQRIHQVRRLLGQDDGVALVTVAGGYRLDVEPGAIDAHRFERLAEEGQQALAAGDAARAASALTQALDLWRGPALQEVDAPWAQVEARRLEERRLAAWEDRVDAELALGRHGAVLPELDHLVSAEPLRERLRGQLMLALAGSGRQADALRVYADGRELLAEELGIDPSPQLRRIHADVLAQRVPVAAAPPGAAPATPALQRGSALPTPVSSFVGRADELRRLAALLDAERLVTVVGPGGAGKTRLVVEAARAALDAGRSVRLVELAPLAEPDAVAATVAAAVGAGGSKDLPVAVALRSALGATPVLLVLDNCEHLVAGVAALVHELVTGCPRLQVLATSREPLGVEGEVVWPLSTLVVPPSGVRSRAEAEEYAAFVLFRDRAHEAAPDLELTDADVPAVVRIVRHLDGLPLAIELAAARLRVLSVAEVAERLHDRFRLLGGGRRSAPARHRTLWDTLEWSWGLLSEEERRAWMAAAVPSGPFPAVLLDELLAAADARIGALEAVTALCDRSLLAVHERAGVTSYRMLEALREFAASRLAASGTEPAVREAHARAVEVAVAATNHCTASTWEVDLDAQRSWLADARAALRWRADRGDRRGVQRIAAGLGWLWYLTALAPEGLRWLDRALGPVDALDPDDVVPDAVFWAAALRVNEAPQDHGVRWAQLAVDLARDDTSASLARAVTAAHRAVAGDLADARHVIAAEPSHEGWLAGYWRLLEGQMLALEGRAAEAEPVLTEAERLLVDHGAWFGAWTTATLVQLAQLRGDPQAVRRSAARGLAVCARHDAPELEVELRCTLAMVEQADDRPDQADDQLRRAQALVDRTGVAMSGSLVAIARGHVLGCRDRDDDARRCLEEGLSLHDRAGQPFGKPFALWWLGRLALRAGDRSAAVRLHTGSLREALRRGDGDGVASALEGLAAVSTAGGHCELGARLLGAAELRRTRLGSPAPLLTGGAAAATRVELERRLPAARLAAERTAGAATDDEALPGLAVLVDV